MLERVSHFGQIPDTQVQLRDVFRRESSVAPTMRSITAKRCS